MGTKVQSKSYLPGYHSMRDLNEDANSFNWPLYYGDKNISTGQYYNGFLPRVTDAHPGHDRDLVKRTMLEHEAIFKNQVYELHRVYRIQRDLMEEIKRKESRQNQIPFETSLSSSPLASQGTSEGARKWNIPSFPLSNSNSARPSVSGAEDTHSPFSHLKGNSALGGSKPKETEVLESRPSKVRRRMFDLHLPADEYIDTEEGEKFKNEKVPEISTYVPNRNHSIAPDGSVKLFGREGGDSRSNLSLRSATGLADLNEPVQVEEINPPEYVDLTGTACHGEIPGHKLSIKGNSQFLGTAKEVSMNSDIRSSNGTINSLYLENGNGRKWYPHMPETGQSKNSLNYASQGFHPGKSSQALLDKPHELPYFQSDQSKIDLCTDRTNSGLSTSGRNRDASKHNHPDNFVASHIPAMYPVSPSPDLVKSWSQSVSPWEKPNSSLNQRSIPVQSHPSLNLSSSQSHGVFGDTRHLTGNSMANSGFGKEFLNQNGFYHGSSSGSRDFLSYNCSNGVSGLFAAHGSSKYLNGSNTVGSVKGVDLNVVLAASSSNGAVSQHGVGFVDGERNHKDHFVGLPWLGSKPANKIESTNSERDFSNWELSFFRSATDQLSCKNDTGKGQNQFFPQNIHSLSSSSHAAANSVSEIVGGSNSKKILGFPIFEKPRASEKECSLSFPQPSEKLETSKKIRLLDINLPCDTSCHDLSQQLVVEKRTDEKVSVVRCLIDLNSCLSEDEAPLVPFVKTTSQIDLEVSADPETEEDASQGEENPKEASSQQDELVEMAAKAIVDISSSVPESNIDVITITDHLNWFAEIACGNDIESKEGEEGSEDSSSEVEEVDYFESMTLKLTETKEEDYMPKPPALDNFQAEETGGNGNLLTARPRRGQARRGRQRRDFQRDILPGLTSLARHEVTEDIQTFGSMMRATGHSWQSGLARRSSGRGRRRTVVVSPPPAPVVAAISACTTQLIQQVSSIEIGVEEISLMGWGKATRRPRRQRCPAATAATAAGNLQSLPLS